MIQAIKDILVHRTILEQEMATPDVAADSSRMEKLGREYNSISKNLVTFQEFLKVAECIQQAKAIIAQDEDPELTALAFEELAEYETIFPVLADKIRYLLTPRDPDDAKNAIVEIRAGTGGVEAGIFGADLYRMYTHYADKRGYTYEVLSFSPGEKDALKEVIFLVSGEEAYGNLKFESGVHRVQRVPLTEAQGRIHTSAASVVVFPEASDVEFTLNPEELRIDVYRSGGAGGQHVNKTESAVRIVHIPTGITAICQDDRSQHKNKAKALKMIQARLYEKVNSERTAEESASRKLMVGSGDRSEKIRTYNFPQDRVTDHRIGLTLHNLPGIINGDIQPLLDALMQSDLEDRLRGAMQKTEGT